MHMSYCFTTDLDFWLEPIIQNIFFCFQSPGLSSVSHCVWRGAKGSCVSWLVIDNFSLVLWLLSCDRCLVLSSSPLFFCSSFRLPLSSLVLSFVNFLVVSWSCLVLVLSFLGKRERFILPPARAGPIPSPHPVLFCPSPLPFGCLACRSP
jgi:hypothetical protein